MAITTRKGSSKGTLSLYRRVPKRYSAVESRSHVWVSLHTDSPSTAKAKEVVVWEQLVATWEAKLAGKAADAEQQYQAVKDLAAAKGFRYLPVDQVAALPRDELFSRFLAISGFGVEGQEPDELEVTALLGGAQEPVLNLSKALETYWLLAKDKTLGKSEDQIRRWKNPRIKAIKNLISVIGDKSIAEISTDDMLDFRDWWMERLEKDELTPNSANKDLIHIGSVLKTVNKMKRLKLDLPLSHLSFKEADKKRRPPFSREWIKDKILAKDALDGLNPEARGILLAMINTGCRPSELAALTENTIHLDHNVPHIAIKPEGRQVKTKHAERVIPLVGVSLEAMRQFPKGFPRYQKNSASLSATINKFMRENGLMESRDHVLYSLRHSFEDRMLAAGIDERIRRDLFGHRLSRERYGDGASLEQKQKLLQAAVL